MANGRLNLGALGEEVATLAVETASSDSASLVERMQKALADRASPVAHGRRDRPAIRWLGGRFAC